MSTPNLDAGERPTSPHGWADALRRDDPVVCSESAGWRSGLVRRWTGGTGRISQPPIDHHYLVLHLGGSKKVTRRGAGRTVCTAVDEGALTLVPAGTRYEWMTVGPIDFAHLYVHPSRLNNVIASKFDRDPASVTLNEQVGFEDALLSQTLQEMLIQVECGGASSNAYLDALLDVAVNNLVHKHSTVGAATRRARHALSPIRLRRVLEVAEARLASSLTLSDLAEVAGLSRHHFSRAFQVAMGEPPMTYLARRRLEAAKRLLREGDLPLAEVGRLSGLGSPSQFASGFRRRTGLTPSDFRRRA